VTVTAPAGLRAPRQARSAASLERVLDAAEALASENGFDATTMAEIARRGRSSIGALYARFRDKGALLDHLHRRFCDRALAQLDTGLAPERWDGRPVREIVASVVTALVHVDTKREGLVRAFVVRGAHDEAFTRRAAHVGRTISRRLSALVLARRAEIACADPEAAVELGVWLVLAHLDQRALFGAVRTTPRTPTPQARAAALTRAFLALLGVAESAGRSRSKPIPSAGRRSARKAGGPR
jgi:AcrR family transcriptional regulator